MRHIRRPCGSVSSFSLRLGVFAGAAALMVGCTLQNADVQKVGTPQYADAVATFYTGTIALQTGDRSGVAEAKLNKIVRIAPQEPAGWANLALLQIRSGDLTKAAENLKNAVERDPATDKIGTARLRALEGLLAKQQGRFADASAMFRDAATLDPTNLRVLYQIKEVLEQQNAPDTDAQVVKLLETLRAAQPRNLEVLLETARLQAKQGQGKPLAQTVRELSALSSNWPQLAKQSLADLVAASSASNVRPAATRAIILRNTLKAHPDYRADADQVMEPTDQTGTPLDSPLILPKSSPLPAPPDITLRYTSTPLETIRAIQLTAFPMDERPGAPGVFTTDGATVRRVGTQGWKPLPFPGRQNVSPGAHAVAPVDIDNDLRTDLVFAGASGVRLYRQLESGVFVDALLEAKLPAEILKGSYTGAWPLDVEADGDLDILLGTSAGPPVVLRNNGDNSFAVIRPFSAVNGVRAFAWADFGGSGVPDAVFLDSVGRLSAFRNERSGVFRATPIPQSDTGTDLGVMDSDGDGLLDVLVTGADGTVRAFSTAGDGLAWKQPVNIVSSKIADPTAYLQIADFDNNGAFDILISGAKGTTLYLRDDKGAFAPLAIAGLGQVAAVADANNDGLLDIYSLDSGKPTLATGSGTKKYGYQKVTLIPANRRPAEDPQKRINAFGIGGEIDIRAGLLYAKQPITGPQMHFGLGENKSVNVVRITWPNGNPQSEFEPKINGSFVAEQRLGGSCPFLFAWDGTRYSFVTDCIWRSPLGLKINAQDTADVMQTTDWVKIRGDQLAARDGSLDMVITAELRETHFFDHLSLMAVDHPEGSEIFVDERLAFPQPPLRLYATAPTKSFASAFDERSNDVAPVVAARDTKYLDTFGRGAYQGVTRDHFVELELPENAPTGVPIYLVAFGWVHPTDTSINVGLGQNPTAAKPTGLSIETQNSAGAWRVVKKDLGFPEGKVKTIVIRIDDAFSRGSGSRRLRLRTNLEIFWDELKWAEARPETPLRTQSIPLASANLRYRGFSVVKSRDESSPELPQDFSRLSGTVAQWRNLEGYHTRFGDVRPLLQSIDDRYVIMNAGDAMDLRFPAPKASPAPGYVRDYVLVGDGWVKDGNLNTTWGSTVLPLPSHAQPKYDRIPTTLDADPVYKQHASDWQNFHTRYVSNERFGHAIKPREKSQ